LVEFELLMLQQIYPESHLSLSSPKPPAKNKIDKSEEVTLRQGLDNTLRHIFAESATRAPPSGEGEPGGASEQGRFTPLGQRGLGSPRFR
jgi:hypothetical protein